MEQTALILPKDLLPEVQALYLKALDGLSIAELRYAFEIALVRCEFFPVPKVILEFAGEYRKSPAHQARLQQIEQEIHERYKQRHLSGQPQKYLKSMLEDEPRTIRDLQGSPEFRRLLRKTNMSLVQSAPPEVAERKGPEWEERLRLQAQELKRRAEEQGKQQ